MENFVTPNLQKQTNFFFVHACTHAQKKQKTHTETTKLPKYLNCMAFFSWIFEMNENLLCIIDDNKKVKKKSIIYNELNINRTKKKKTILKSLRCSASWSRQVVDDFSLIIASLFLIWISYLIFDFSPLPYCFWFGIKFGFWYAIANFTAGIFLFTLIR